MRKYEKKQVAETRTVCTEIACDLCGAISGSPGGKWGRQTFDFAETTIELEEGVRYPEGGNGTRIVVDLCPNCFRNKLIPWLTAQGADIQETEWDN